MPDEKEKIGNYAQQGAREVMLSEIIKITPAQARAIVEEARQSYLQQREQRNLINYIDRNELRRKIVE
ncbi:hypothetical protein HYT26_04730 [Candidatus Pacearchaeota archaeon]|nr:hypothetical protein [Candidatus Pacearchaeota archaeon]